ncbi:proteasome accessory factor PafA2 family protein [Candidatus Saccharibacteria bacterium]|nr:proteasome accessory factor PafA2 family protein [Candidatus Saccharibacteria bacterium]
MTEQELLHYAPHLPRVAGLESEYGIYAPTMPSVSDFQLSDPNLKIIIDNMHNLHGGSVIPNILGYSAFGRVYEDVGRHIEHATNEYIDYASLAYAKTGADLRLVDAVQCYLQQLERTDGHSPATYALLPIRSSDGFGNFWGGVHINLAMPRSGFNRILGNEAKSGITQNGLPIELVSFASFLVCSAITMGKGALRADDGKFNVCPPERLQATYKLVGGGTTSSRPLVNSRDEPHADKNVHARLHIISQDVHTRPLTTALQLSVLSAMLRTIEIGKPLEYNLDLGELGFIRTIARLASMHHMDEQTVYSPKGTASMTIFELFARNIEQLRILAHTEGFPAQEVSALEIAYDAINLYLNGDINNTKVRVLMPWVYRKLAIDRSGLTGRPLKSEEVEELKAIDRTFDSYLIKPDKIVVGAELQRVRTPKVVEIANKEILTPPTNTRADIRAKFIASIPEHAKNPRISWSQGYYDEEDRRITWACSDPRGLSN